MPSMPPTNASTMSDRSDLFDRRYAVAARLLHWLIALLVLFLIPAGIALRFDLIPQAWHRTLAELHIGTGITVLVLMVLRLTIRFLFPPPPLPGAIPPVERQASAASHFGFYALLFLMPIAGILFVQAGGRVVSWFGLANLPVLVGKNPSLHDLAYAVHFWGGFLLLGLVLLHVLAVIHHARSGRSILRRMWW